MEINNAIIESYKYPDDIYNTIVIIPSGVKYIGSYTFCYNSITTIIMPDTVIEISPHAFKYSYNLKNIRFSKNLKTIGSEAFFMSSIKNVILPEGLIKIKDDAFSKCPYLKSIDFTKATKLKYKDMVLGINRCKNLKEMKLTDSIKREIKRSTSYHKSVALFYDCPQLKESYPELWR